MLKSEYNSLTKSTGFPALKQINGDADYCQIQQLGTSYSYSIICLSYYYRSTYILSLIKYSGSTFQFFQSGSIEYSTITFSLLKNSSISMIYFESQRSLGIFYQDIDKDSMIIVFYRECGKDFDKVSSSCNQLNSPPSGYYYDECTHSFLLQPEGYISIQTNQSCQIKKIECADGYFLDSFIDGYYKCWSKTSPPNGYVFVDDGFKKCYRGCLKCTGTSNGQCTACNIDNGYYPVDDGTNYFCYHKNEPVDHYYFDTNTNTFVKCRKECLRCKEIPSTSDLPDGQDTDSSKDTKCLVCDTNYWPQVDNPSNCIHKEAGTSITKYFANQQYKRWDKCAKGCLHCETYGTSIYDTKCVVANGELCDTDNNYVPYEINDPLITDRLCLIKNKIYNYYYYNATLNIFRKCHISCLQCNTIPYCLADKCNRRLSYRWY